MYILRAISIYTLSDLGDLSNLIGSLSRTIQQYSAPSEWIMCELGVFPIFSDNDLLKNVIVRDSQPIRLLELPRSLSVYILKHISREASL